MSSTFWILLIIGVLVFGWTVEKITQAIMAKSACKMIGSIFQSNKIDSVAATEAFKDIVNSATRSK